MRKMLVLLVLVGVVLLAGCDFLAFFQELLPGVFGDEHPQFSAIVINYGFDAQVMHKGVGVETRTLSVQYESIADVIYTESLDSYSSQSPINDLPYIYINISLDSTGTLITYLGAWRRTQYQNGTWERVDQITAENIPLDREVGSSKFFRIDASDVGWDGLVYADYKDWLVAQTTDLDPTYRILNTYDAQAYFDTTSGRYIEIELRQ